MSEAIQNCPEGVTPIPGSPSWLRVSPVPLAGGRGLPPVHTGDGPAAAWAGWTVRGAAASAAIPSASSARQDGDQDLMTEPFGCFVSISFPGRETPTGPLRRGPH